MSDVKTHFKKHYIDPSYEEIVEIVFKRREHVFFHSPGGTGKSFYLKKLFHDSDNFGLSAAITSSTGISGVYIGGCTVHSWAGIGIGKETPEKNVMTMKEECRERWNSTHLLLLDEISMIGSQLIDNIDQTGALVRGSDEPFGGVQQIWSGDLLQLPPIDQGFVFQSNVWPRLNFTVITLQTPHRFANVQYYDMLSRIRIGAPTNNDLMLLINRISMYKLYITPAKEKNRIYTHYLLKHIPKDLTQIILDYVQDHPDDLKIKPTELFCLKKDVDAINIGELNKIKRPLCEYKAVYTYKLKGNRDKKFDQKYYEKIIKTNVPELILLKVGAQVMLTINFDQARGLVNGSRGVVIECHPEHVVCEFKTIETITENVLDSQEPREKKREILTREIIMLNVYEYSDKKVKVTGKQIPLILAYSMTIHKVQGATLDSVIVDLGKSVFEFALIYVALSRAKSLDKIYITDLNIKMIKANQVALKFVKELENM